MPETMIDMKVSQLTHDPYTRLPILILKDASGVEALPIWIGLVEASAIAVELEKITLERPMTHDLLKSIIGECGVTVDRVEVTDVKDHTFFAQIHLHRPGGKPIAVDARPSDAIALALRTGARICVSRKVLERAQEIDLGRSACSARADAEMAGEAARLHDLLEGLGDDEFGKWKM